MKANELRIGNWAMYSSKIQVNENKIRECVDHPDRFAPIFLTEEWLERFGFEKIGGWDDYEAYILNEVEITINENVPFKNYLDKEIKHVHQLQNLYFALTGQELELKP
jgi:hypothetical protein